MAEKKYLDYVYGKKVIRKIDNKRNVAGNH